MELRTTQEAVQLLLGEDVRWANECMENALSLFRELDASELLDDSQWHEARQTYAKHIPEIEEPLADCLKTTFSEAYLTRTM